jgi:hypothetical protein
MIPITTNLGNYRMRIGGTDEDAGPNSPCYAGSYGTFEDYTLQVIEAPSCMPILGGIAIAISNPSANSATVTWVAPNPAPANGYQVLVSTSATEPAGSEPEIETPIDTFLNISNLNASTPYYVWVRADCGGGDYSSWTYTLFTTPCNATALPYTQNFDDNANLPSCWTFFGNFSIVNSHATSSPNTLRFNGNRTNVALLPVFDVDVNMATISFVLRRESEYSSGSMDLGYLTNILDFNSFVAVQTNILTTEESITPFDINLSTAGFPSGVKNIAFKQTTSNNYWYWLDDVSVFVCTAPAALAHSAITANSATLTWEAGGSETEWQLEWKETADNIWNPATGIATNHTYDLQGLTATTSYDARVRAICSVGDTSDWSTTITFTTQQTCNAPTGLNAPEISDHSIKIVWTAVNGETEWLVSWSSPGNVGNAPVSGSATYTLTDLLSDTTYRICVKAICSETTSSADTCIEVSTTVGINNISLASGVKLYPNPASDQLTIEMESRFNTVEVTNTLGQVVYKANLTEKTKVIDVTGYSAGMYYVKLQGDAGMVTRKFVKK